MIPYVDFTIPHIPLIHVFGILVAIGIIVGAHLTKKRARELGLVDEKVDSMITFVVIMGILFAHWFDVFAYQTFGGHPTLWDILNPIAGLSSFGGFIGAVSALFLWCKYKREPVMPYADSLAFGLATGWMFGRLGCFTAHDHPGAHTAFFLAVRYPDGPRHDLGLDEALWAAAVSLLFAWLRRKPRRIGTYVSLLTVLYAPVRFGLDFLRARDVPEPDPRYYGLTPAQWGCFFVLVAGIGLTLWTLRRPRPGAAQKV